MDPERFAERMLEIENLTDELEDAEAQLLLDWGIAELGPLLADVQDSEAAGEKANGLIGLMRKINRLVGRMTGKAPDQLAEELTALDEVWRAIYPGAAPSSASQAAQSPASFSALDTRSALQLLLKRPTPSAAIEPDPTSEPPSSGDIPPAPVPVPIEEAPPAPDTPAEPETPPAEEFPPTNPTPPSPDTE